MFYCSYYCLYMFQDIVQKFVTEHCSISFSTSFSHFYLFVDALYPGKSGNYLYEIIHNPQLGLTNWPIGPRGIGHIFIFSVDNVHITQEPNKFIGSVESRSWDVTPGSPSPYCSPRRDSLKERLALK